ncbi:MAG: hypothetical protein JSU89_15755 [Myxococcales bacterium]|nr:MAG: hypothetical protein JSU89_15755 [Myxococcales bacterium]
MKMGSKERFLRISTRALVLAGACIIAGHPMDEGPHVSLLLSWLFLGLGWGFVRLLWPVARD